MCATEANVQEIQAKVLATRSIVRVMDPSDRATEGGLITRVAIIELKQARSASREVGVEASTVDFEAREGDVVASQGDFDAS